jgi:dTDP-L-rhamnose 4-epimerase
MNRKAQLVSWLLLNLIDREMRMPREQERVLVTGGAGFIGRAVVRELAGRGAEVRVLDALIAQVHGEAGWPEGLRDQAECRHGDVRDADAVRAALDGVTSVIHLAAEVGVGQSMYAIERYTSTNDLGTAVLLEQMAARPIRRIVTASSMSIYGEGRYRDVDGGIHDAVVRAPDALRRRAWDPLDAAGRPLLPLPTPEAKPANLASVYAIGKYVQERLTLTVAGAYGIEAACLRLWNVFGPGQALSNPYTGVLAIFASRIANGRPPLVFEDGRQLRDFVHVDDVARAFVLALDHPAAPGGVFNIGGGGRFTVNEVGRELAAAMGSAIEPEMTGSGRTGDIRHCIPDMTSATTTLGYAPREALRTRLVDLAEWVVRQDAADHVGRAADELRARGLVT